MEREEIKLSEGLEMHYYPRFLDDYESLFREAEKLSFSDEIVTMYGKSFTIKRRTVDYGLGYTYNPTAKGSIAWEPLAVALREKLEKYFGLDFPQCACNEFSDHESYIGPHHDKATIIGDERREPLYVASISLGAIRKMVMVPPGADLKGMQPTVDWLMANVMGSLVKPLAPGSLVLFSNAVNRTWKHSIPQDRKSEVTGKRISLTYRHF
jgi:alkylated DNA repair dioxygenase AlkB